MIRKVRRGAPEYPPELEKIFYPPKQLFVRGGSLADLKPRLAIVGSRKCSAYGREIARNLAAELACLGIVIVSGLAKGIDAAAHEGALRGGRTIAVLGCGFNFIYPRENRRLYEDIPRKGAIISEYQAGTAPRAKNFPARNRVISGLSLGVIIVEAAVKSGALITADFALEQGKEVMVVPGHIKSPTSGGCHKLLKEGAALVTSVEDVLEVMGLEGETAPAEDTELTEEQAALLAAMEYELIHVDALAAKTGRPVAEVLSDLLALEIKGVIKKESGARVIRIK